MITSPPNKKNILLLIASIIIYFPDIITAQISPPDLIINNTVITSGTQSFSNYTGIVSPGDNSNVSISGGAQVEYKAGEYIALKPGFSASAFTGNGNFHAFIERSDFDVTVIDGGPGYYQETGDVLKFDKLEYGLNLPPIIDNLVATYFAGNSHNPLGINPFDPDDINIVATFTSPSGTQSRTINGFYFEDFSSTWAPIATDYNFRVRFAPTELGQWTCSISVNSPNGKFPSTYTANNLHFTCIPPASGMYGYLQVGLHKRQLKFSGTGASFFPIGQNIAWIDHSQWGTNNFIPSEFTTFTDRVRNISYSPTQSNGGNFVRIIMAPWSHGIEWENLGDYSDYTSNTGIPQNRQHNAFELDKVFEDCRTSGVYVNLNLEMHTSYHFSSTQLESLYLWANNPYHTKLGLSQIGDMLTNVDAKKYFKRRLRYIIARWGYSRNLAVIELLSEQDGWGWDANTETHSYDSQMSYDMYNWHQEMGDYIKNTLSDKNHLLSTSYGNRNTYAPSSFSAPIIDVTSGHKYGEGRGINKERYDYMTKMELDIQNKPVPLLYYDKPSIFGEMGLNEKVGVDVDDIEGCDDVGFHNNLWSTSFMGGYGTGLNWWQWKNDGYRATNYGPLASFFANVDFEANKFTYPDYWKEPHIPGVDYRTEVFSLRNFNKEKVMGWAHNATYWWGNISENCPDDNGNYMPLPNQMPDNDSPFDPVDYCCEKIKIQNLKWGTKYNIEWYYTRGQNTAYPFSTVSEWSIFGNFKVTMPIGADFAFKAYKAGTAFRDLNEIPIDTLYCGEDTIHVNGTYEDDTAGVYTYNWNFGNGQTSSLPYPTIIYSSPGTYTVKLIVTNLLGYSDTLQQQIVVWSCNESRSGNKVTEDSITTAKDELPIIAMTIVPNPNNGVFRITATRNNKTILIREIKVFDMMGKAVWFAGAASSNKVDIDISKYSNGIYYVRIINELGEIEMKKVIKN